jgi:hypothetical protein
MPGSFFAFEGEQMTPKRDLEGLLAGAPAEVRNLDTPEFRAWLNTTLDRAPALTDRQCRRISGLLWPDR